jgi:hypothetical protein
MSVEEKVGRHDLDAGAVFANSPDYAQLRDTRTVSRRLVCQPRCATGAVSVSLNPSKRRSCSGLQSDSKLPLLISD